MDTIGSILTNTVSASYVFLKGAATNIPRSATGTAKPQWGGGKAPMERRQSPNGAPANACRSWTEFAAHAMNENAYTMDVTTMAMMTVAAMMANNFLCF
jgi:hypothetical protein